MDHRNRRHLIVALSLGPLAALWRTPAVAQANVPRPLTQPSEPTKAAFLARARALRDEAVREGDQAYGAVVVRDSVIVGEGRNYVVLQNDPTAHSELLAVRDAARRMGTRDLSQCDVYSTATPCAMCQARSTGGACAACSPRARSSRDLPRNSGVRDFAGEGGGRTEYVKGAPNGPRSHPCVCAPDEPLVDYRLGTDVCSR